MTREWTLTYETDDGWHGYVRANGSDVGIDEEIKVVEKKFLDRLRMAFNELKLQRDRAYGRAAWTSDEKYDDGVINDILNGDVEI